MTDDNSFDTPSILSLTGIIATAFISNNQVPAAQLPDLIKNVHTTLAGLKSGPVDPALKPAVPIKKSVTAEYVICLEDGKRLKMLKRYLRSRYALSPEEYRQKWGLPADYPMVAPNYAARRSEFAKKIGLGRSHDTNKKRRRA